MKKILFLLILIFLFATVYGARLYDVERGNDLVHIEIARSLSGLEGVKDAAVLSCEGGVLAGVRILEEADAESIRGQAERLLKESFSEKMRLRLEVGGKGAEDIVDLSRYLETKMDKRVLKKRFEFLVEGEKSAVGR